jgi:hypothetical protein
MKIEKQTILIADEGMLLTDGKNFVKKIRLPEEADEKVWDEITEEEYNALQIVETEMG